VNACSHNTANFQNPFTYDPSRFLGKPEHSTDRLDAMQPFSVGPRSCIGKK
jgi:cytochrome P450